MDPMTGMMIGGTVLGALGGKGQANAANQPRTTRTNQTSTRTPYGGGNPALDWFLGEGYNHYQNRPDLGPNQSQALFNQMLGGGGGGAGAGSSGGGGGSQGGGGGRGGGGGGRGGERRMENRLANFQVNLRPELQALISGQGLGANDAGIEGLLGNIRREAVQGFGESLPALTSQFGSGGRYGSGAMAQALTGASEQFNEALQGTLSQVQVNQHNAERDRIVQGLQIASQLDAAGRSDLGGIMRANIAKQAQLGASRIAANASMSNARTAAGSQAAALAQAREFGLFDRAMGLDQMSNNAAMNDMNSLSWLGQLGLPILSGFGSENTQGTNVQPGAGISPWGAFFQGGLGGGMSGAGLGRMLGGGGGGANMYNIPPGFMGIGGY